MYVKDSDNSLVLTMHEDTKIVIYKRFLLASALIIFDQAMQTSENRKGRIGTRSYCQALCLQKDNTVYFHNQEIFQFNQSTNETTLNTDNNTI